MSLKKSVELLSRVPFFDQFSSEQLKLLAFSGEIKRYVHGTALFTFGDYSDGGLVIMRGNVAIHPQGVLEEHDDRLLIGSASLLGQRALLTQTRQSSTALAKGPVEVLKLRRKLFTRMLKEYPDIAVLVYRRMRDELNHLCARMAPISTSLKHNIPDHISLENYVTYSAAPSNDVHQVA